MYFVFLLLFLIGVQFSPAERGFVVESYLQNKKKTLIKQEFEAKFGHSISRRHIYCIYDKFKTSHTCHNLNKGRSGRKKTARSPANIAAVQNLLQNEVAFRPDDVRSSSRRNPIVGLSQSGFNRITRIDLKLQPYRLLRQQKLKVEQCRQRKAMCNFLKNQPVMYYNNLCVSDEAWFTVGGHIFNRKNTVCYSPRGDGTPDHFFSEAAQSEKKVMVFLLLTGGGEKFGPYFYSEDETITAHKYKMLLIHHVFPELKNRLRQRKFDWLIWQQDGASVHTAVDVMTYLDRIFAD